MQAREELRRELGFWDALTIGVGTMIGAGIFLLAGTALELTGPAAVLSYLAAAFVCVLTAASAAELATGMPTSGGAYYFVSRAFGPAVGAVAGIGTWLSLTVAISFYLFGLGEYLAHFLPLTPFWGAMLGAVALTALNVWGAKESGRTQVAIVVTLVGILAVFAVGGFFHVEASHLQPFFPFGGEPILTTTALVFVSFLGFVKIAAVAEEIRDPGRNLPRALVGSVVVVTILYVVIVLVIGSVFPQETIGEVRDPLTSAARLFFGPVGGAAIIFAGLLATASSANASIMASSRINLAMARDRLVPKWLSGVHDTLLTPHRAILLTGGLAAAFLFVKSLHDLAEIASSLQLVIYAALNLACVVLRGADPDWYRPSYRTPGYPYLQIVGTAGCLAIIAYSSPYAKLAVGVLVGISLVWFMAWGRNRVRMEHAGPALGRQWARLGIRAFFLPPTAPEGAEEVAELPKKRVIEVDRPRRVLVALAAPEHEADLLRMGRYIATGREDGGDVAGVHFTEIPLHTTLQAAREQRSAAEQWRDVDEAALREIGGPGGVAGAVRSVDRTRVEISADYTHDLSDALVAETEERGADLLLMGWRGEFSLRRILEHPVQHVMDDLKADMAVLKDRGLGEGDRILLPWGGGIHARLGLEVALRIARCTGDEVDLLRVVKKDVDPQEEETSLLETADAIAGGAAGVRIHIRRGESVTDGIVARMAEHPYRLVVIGASRESRIRQVLFGSIPDRVADEAPCSVLMVRRYLPDHWTVRASEAVKRLKEGAGLTTSPGEPGA